MNGTEKNETRWAWNPWVRAWEGRTHGCTVFADRLCDLEHLLDRLDRQRQQWRETACIVATLLGCCGVFVLIAWLASR